MTSGASKHLTLIQTTHQCSQEHIRDDMQAGPVQFVSSFCVYSTFQLCYVSIYFKEDIQLCVTWVNPIGIVFLSIVLTDLKQ